MSKHKQLPKYSSLFDDEIPTLQYPHNKQTLTNEQFEKLRNTMNTKSECEKIKFLHSLINNQKETMYILDNCTDEELNILVDICVPF